MPVLRRFVTILDWLPGYSKEDLRYDAIAGATIGIILIPQSMAYAVLLGVPPVYGLYASIIPLLVYPIFGTSRHLALSVTAIDMLVAGAGLSLIATPGTARYVGLAIVLAMSAGLLQILMGITRMGFVVNLLSRPVIAGFTSAAAIVICFSQLENLLGIDLTQTEYVFILILEAVEDISAVHWLTSTIGIMSIVLLFVLRRWKPVFPGPIFVAVLGTLLVWFFDLDTFGVEVIGEIPSGLPAIEVPPIEGRSLRSLIPTAITLGLVQFMNVVSLGKIFGARHRYRVRPNRELIAVGAANVVGSFFNSIPVSGSFSRTAVNERAGARSPMSNVVAAVLIAVTLLFLTPLFYYLPIPVLAAIIVVAAVVLVDLREVRLLMRLKRVDGAIALFTFIATLVAGVVEGVLLGVGASVVAIMFRISRPNVATLGHLPGTQSFGDLSRHREARELEGILLLRIDASFSFTNAEFLRDIILEHVQSEMKNLHAVVIDATSINDLDTTAVEVLFFLAETLDERGIEMYFGGVKGNVGDVMARAGLVDLLGRHRFYVSPHEAVRQILSQRGTLEAYLRATEEYVDAPGRARREPPSGL